VLHVLVLYAGGFFHGVHSLTFGVDLTKIRLMGILQVPFLIVLSEQIDTFSTGKGASRL
jgi:hypothetical protein